MQVNKEKKPCLNSQAIIHPRCFKATNQGRLDMASCLTLVQQKLCSGSSKWEHSAKNVARHNSEMSTLHALVRQYYYPMVIQGNQNQLSIILGITHNTWSRHLLNIGSALITSSPWLCLSFPHRFVELCDRVITINISPITQSSEVPPGN